LLLLLNYQLEHALYYLCVFFMQNIGTWLLTGRLPSKSDIMTRKVRRWSFIYVDYAVCQCAGSGIV